MPRQVDDDIFLPPFSLLSLLRMGPLGDEQGCGVVLPLTQNGIPSTEIFARHWLSAAVAHMSWCRYSLAGYVVRIFHIVSMACITI